MRIRRWYFSLVLAFAFLGLCCLALPAQEPPKEEQKAAQQTASAKPGEAPSTPAVPPEMLEKAKTYKGAPIPPKDLKKANSHWSPYEAPVTPPEGAEVYTIQPGDSLSLISQRQLGNQYLWPQIWDLNPYIKDAHWIYPGDPLFIKKPQVVNEEVPIAEAVPPKPPEEAKPPADLFVIEQEAPMPPVSAYDIYCSGYITKDYKRTHLRVVQSATPERASLAQGDVIYLNEGELEGIQAGQAYQIVAEGQIVHHPVSGKALGQFIRRVGQAKVLAVQPHTSIAEISQSCDEIWAGMALLPYRVIPIPWDIKRSDDIPLQLPVSQKASGRIIWTEDRLGSVTTHNVVYIDLGAESQLLPGDKLWVYRYPMKQGTLLQSTSDLFRQEKVNVPVKDLFRPPKAGTYEQKAAGVEGEEGGDIAADGGEIVMPTASENPVDVTTEVPPSGPEEAVKNIRQYLGEAVVLTIEKKTACVKLISTNKEIVIGDWVQLE